MLTAIADEALITSITPVPDIEFVIETGDTGLPAGAPWVLGRKAAQEQLTLLPGTIPAPGRLV